MSEVEEKRSEFKWTTDYAFALALSEGEGDWGNAQFTSPHTYPDSEVFYEPYNIIKRKVHEWNQFKREDLI